jgi:hypothetical protein
MRDQINKMLAASEPETQASVAEPPDSQVPADLPIPE